MKQQMHWNHTLKERRVNAMKRMIALVVGVFLSVLLIAPMNVTAGSDAGNKKVTQSGKKVKGKPTPKAAKDWNEQEKKRSAYKNKALETRKQQMSKTSE
jgi:hypothetical protein